MRRALVLLRRFAQTLDSKKPLEFGRRWKLVDLAILALLVLAIILGVRYTLPELLRSKDQALRTERAGSGFPSAKAKSVGFKSDSGPPWYVVVIGLVIFGVSLSMLYDEEYEVRQKK